MSVKDNLIAAKALIGKVSNPLYAIRDAVSGESDRTQAYNALRDHLPDDYKYVMLWFKTERPSRPDIMALFDRAIEASE